MAAKLQVLPGDWFLRYFHRDSGNIDVALRCFGQGKARQFKSGFIYLVFLVAGARNRRSLPALRCRI